MTRIKKKKLYEEVIQGIEAMLRSKNLQAGDRLQSEKELALYFGVSKTAVREALSAMQTAGMIEVKHGSGIYVRNVNEMLANPLTLKLLTDWDNLLGILELCKCLETEGAFMAAQRAAAPDIAEIKAKLLAMAESVEQGENAAEAELNFHSAVIKATHNSAFSSIFDSIASIFHEGMRICHEYYAIHQVSVLTILEENRLIYEAIKKKNPDKARELMKKHLENFENTLRDLKS